MGKLHFEINQFENFSVNYHQKILIVGEKMEEPVKAMRFFSIFSPPPISKNTTTTTECQTNFGI